MSKVTFDYSKASAFISNEEVSYMEKLVADAKEQLVSKTGAGNDFLGWIDLPVDYDKEEFARIKKAAEKIQSDSEVLVVIGIGGSYLGARAAIEFLRHGFYNNLTKEARKTPEIYYAGNSISGTYLKGLVDVIGDRDFSVNIISKSGTTTEPAIAFRVFKAMLEEKYGKEGAAKRIYATTDKAKGALKNLATEEGYETFVVPDDVGGRFSVLTAVGLLPIAVSGADIAKLIEKPTATYEVKRLSEKLGEPFIMTFRAIPSDEFADIQRVAMSMKGGKLGDVDLYKMQVKTIVASAVDPKFKDKDLMRAFGCATPDDVVARLFVPGEISELNNQIGKLNGFEPQSDVDREVKN